MTWTHLPLGNKTSRFTQSALALMIAGTLPAYAGTFNPRFLEDVPGIDQHVDLSMYESNKAEHLPGKYRVSVGMLLLTTLFPRPPAISTLQTRP